MLRRINDALPGLLLGILIYGVLVEFCGVWFVEDKFRFTVGLVIGIGLACGMAINMAVVLKDAVDIYADTKTQRRVVARSGLRYILVIVAFFVMAKWDVGNYIIAFIGLLGLKISAYLQPIMQGAFRERKRPVLVDKRDG